MRPRDADTGTGDEQRRPPTATINGHVASSPRTSAPSASPIAITTGAAATRRTIVAGPARATRWRSRDVVHPTASTAPKNPAAAGAMPASRWPNSGTYMSTIVAAISSPIVTYIHFSGPGRKPRAAAPWPRHAGRRPGTPRPVPRRRPAGRTWLRRHRCTPATLTASAAAPSSSSDHTGIRGIAQARPSIRWRAGSATGTRRGHRHRQDRQRPECPTPDTELGEHPARGGTHDHARHPTSPTPAPTPWSTTSSAARS